MSDKSHYIEEYRAIDSKKSLGQHFLTNDFVTEKMVKDAEVNTDDAVLEIGSGLGILTKAIFDHNPRQLILCEKDRDLAEILKKKFTSKKIKIITEDALLLIPNLQVSPPFKVVSNLPYNISSPVIVSLLTTSQVLPATIAVMLQKEVAQRICAKGGDSNRGILTILVELFGQGKITDKVSKNQFYPAPQVDSAVVVISQIKKPEVNPKKFLKMLKMSFAGKRKKIKNSLFSTLKIDFPKAQNISKRAGVDLDLRPEDLTIGQWKKLFNEIESYLR